MALKNIDDVKCLSCGSHQVALYGAYANATENAAELIRLREFACSIAAEPCYENPGEFPEPGESGHAPCLSCRARAAIAKAEAR